MAEVEMIVLVFLCILGACSVLSNEESRIKSKHIYISEDLNKIYETPSAHLFDFSQESETLHSYVSDKSLHMKKRAIDKKEGISTKVSIFL